MHELDPHTILTCTRNTYRMITLIKLSSASLLSLSTLLLAAAPQDATKLDPSLKGAVKIDGSSTVYPITEAVAEEFNKVAGKVRVKGKRVVVVE